MENHNLLETIESGADAAAASTRRDALSAIGKLGLGAFASVSALSALRPRRALAQAVPQEAVDILNFALTLEYLESVYYNTGIATDGLIPEGAGQTVYGTIADHENKHVTLLVAAIEAAGGTPVGPFDESNFDFTAGGVFPDPFADYGVYLALSQAFEDTGVRAYKGQAANISAELNVEVSGVGTFNLLTTALQIHALEARHAAEVRRIRASMGADLKPWITLDELGGVPADAASVYAGEENLMQAGLDTTTLGEGFSAEHASEAYDEPLTMSEANAIAGLFIVS